MRQLPGKLAPGLLAAILAAACAGDPPPAAVADAGPPEDQPEPIVVVIQPDAGPVIPPPVGVACFDDADCYPRGQCWRGFCTGSCNTTGDCGTEVISSCLSVPELGGKRCVQDGRRCYAAPAGRDLFGDALSEVGLDRCAVGFPATTLEQFRNPQIENDEFRMPYFNAVFHSGLRLPDFEDTLARELTAAQAGASPVAATLARLAREHGAMVNAAPFPAPVTLGANPLAVAVGALILARGGAVDQAALDADAADVPLRLQLKLAALVNGIKEAAAGRDRMLGATSALDAYRYAAAYSLTRADGQALDPANAAVRRRYGRDYQYAQIYEAAARLAATVQAEDWAVEAGATGFSFNATTPIGRVIVKDAATHLHAATDPAYAGDIALLVDTGGADVYTVAAGGNTSSSNPVAVCLDLAGNDRYGYEVVASPFDTGQRLPADAGGRDNSTDVTHTSGPISFSDTPRQGAGRAGVGLLFDLGGDDRYRSLRMSQGFGAVGAGALFDASGADSYEGEAGVQGAALFGIGLLLDRAGDDTYSTWTLSQGFAGVRGFGLLFDAGGRDVYHADVGDPSMGGDPLYYSSHQPGIGNRSFVQGAGFGLRANPGSMSGGIGMLVDRGGGDDSYLGSVYSQAAGYWFGSGFLDDDGGADQYQGKVWAQGTTAHFAMSLFRDRGGDDRYNTAFQPVEDVMGMSHDYAVSWLIEHGGDDTYVGSSWQNSMGVGLTNGMGFFVDLGGLDEYRVYNLRSLGFADVQFTTPQEGRIYYLTVGVLIDAAGQDAYFEFDAQSDVNGKTRVYNRHPELVNEAGVLADGDGSAVPLPW